MFGGSQQLQLPNLKARSPLDEVLSRQSEDASDSLFESQLSQRKQTIGDRNNTTMDHQESQGEIESLRRRDMQSLYRARLMNNKNKTKLAQLNSEAKKLQTWNYKVAYDG